MKLDAKSTISETHSTFSEKTISCYKLIDKLYKKNISISKINILESEFVISNAIIAAKDIKNHKNLDKILKITPSSSQIFLATMSQVGFCRRE